MVVNSKEFRSMENKLLGSAYHYLQTLDRIGIENSIVRDAVKRWLADYDEFETLELEFVKKQNAKFEECAANKTLTHTESAQ